MYKYFIINIVSKKDGQIFVLLIVLKNTLNAIYLQIISKHTKNSNITSITVKFSASITLDVTRTRNFIWKQPETGPKSDTIIPSISNRMHIY